MVKILIADDEYLERAGLSILIEKFFKEDVLLKEAGHGKEALRLSDTFLPDLIFMDIKMPGMNGIEASKFIKKKHPQMTIVILSAYDEFELAREALRIGVEDYLLKPPKPEDIDKILHKHLLDKKREESFGDSKPSISFPKRATISESTSPAASSSVQPVLEYLEEHLEDNLSLEEAAKILKVTPAYFSRLFKKEMGVNYNNYLNRKKIEKAKNLLKNSDLPILNIAMDLGFTESNYFTKVFKKIVGVTPREYRKKKKI